MRKFFLWMKNYAKRHTFHMIVLVALIILGVIQVSQYAMIGSVYGLTRVNDANLFAHVTKYQENRAVDKKELQDLIEEKGREFSARIEGTRMQFDAKLDILDSAIKPEKKRRMLIVKVRNAITENTDTKLTIKELNNIAIAVIDYSYHYNLSIAKVLAQMKQESDFNIGAKSRAKAQGLMQIIPETWEYIVLKEFESKRADPYNIYHNIRAGCFYMSEQVMKFDNYDDALRAYNWGPDKVRKLLIGEYIEENIPKETINYVRLINEWITVFEEYGLE